MAKYLLLLTTFLFFSFSSQAQFKKLLKKAKHIAKEEVLGDNSSGSQTDQSSSENNNQKDNTLQNQASPAMQEENAKQAPLPIPIDFPVTGDTVYAIHGILAPVLDGAAAKIKKTPQGKYFFQLAREKGLKGSDADILRESMDTKNQEIMKEIKLKIEDKFPKAARANRKRQRKLKMGYAGNNPAWGGVSAPSLYFWAYVGSFDVLITPGYIRAAMRHAHFTIADVFGVNAVGITDLFKNITYSVGSVLGTKFTMVTELDTVNGYNIYNTYGLVKKEYMGIPGIKMEAGKAGVYGKYHTVSEKIVIPVRPFVEEATGEKSDALLRLHDILANRTDAAEKPPQYNRNYKIIYEFYFTHDLDSYLAPNLKKKLANGLTGKEGICIGAKVRDENGNSVNYRLIDVKTIPVDKGVFQVPDDYPVMTQQELNEAVKEKFSLKNLFKGALKNTGNEEEN